MNIRHPRKYTALVRGRVRSLSVLTQNLLIQIPPIRIVPLNKPHFPQSPPFLETLLIRNRFKRSQKRLRKDQPEQAIMPDKPRAGSIAMLCNSQSDVIRHACVKRTVFPVGEDVDVEHDATTACDPGPALNPFVTPEMPQALSGVTFGVAARLLLCAFRGDRNRLRLSVPCKTMPRNTDHHDARPGNGKRKIVAPAPR